MTSSLTFWANTCVPAHAANVNAVINIRFIFLSVLFLFAVLSYALLFTMRAPPGCLITRGFTPTPGWRQPLFSLILRSGSLFVPSRTPLFGASFAPLLHRRLGSVNYFQHFFSLFFQPYSS
jgi:hypothetical protein